MKLSKDMVLRGARSLGIAHPGFWDYRTKWNDLPLDPNLVLIEPSQGRSPFGNMFYILQELATNPAYSHLRLAYVCVPGKGSMFRQVLSDNGITGVEIVPRLTSRYATLLATATYLFTDMGFTPYYIKKEGQVLCNTWHGTPIKTLGRSNTTEIGKLGNMQRNLFLSDYILVPNNHTKRVLLDDYMVRNLFNGSLLYCGQPRNSAFFKDKNAGQLRAKNNLDTLTVWAYMPTYRGSVYGKVGNKTILAEHLSQMDSYLSDQEVLYVNLHPLDASTVPFGNYQHIRSFPYGVEPYQFLQACDALVTDYSSVLFDFAVTRKPIVLFNYDEEDYARNRGLYSSLSTLPFACASSCSETIQLLRCGAMEAGQDFVDEYCSYDAVDVPQAICARIVLGKQDVVQEEKHVPSGRKRIALHSSGFAKNGITAALRDLLGQIDYSCFDPYLVFPEHALKDKSFLEQLPRNISFIPLSEHMPTTLQEKIAFVRFAANALDAQSYRRVANVLQPSEVLRHFGDMQFDAAIQYSSYNFQMTHLFENMPHNAAFVHSFMNAEEQTKDNAQEAFLAQSFPQYQAIAAVSPAVAKSVNAMVQGAVPVHVVPNVFNYRRVRELATQELQFDVTTKANVTCEDLNKRLCTADKTIICIARYSPEKQLDMLLEAFLGLHSEMSHPNLPSIHLAVIGGTTRDGIFEALCARAEEAGYANCVSLVLGMSNPYPVLAASKGLILPSAYEGFGLVLLEAAALGIPCVCTDMEGPRAFMEAHGGSMVDNSMDGIKAGLRMLQKGNVDPLQVDFESYNQEAMDAFYTLLAEIAGE